MTCGSKCDCPSCSDYNLKTVVVCEESGSIYWEYTEA